MFSFRQVNTQPRWTGLDSLTLEAEFLVLVTAMDETFSQTVHARTSYTHAEIEFGSRFATVLSLADDSAVEIDLRRFHEIQRADSVSWWHETIGQVLTLFSHSPHCESGLVAVAQEIGAPCVTNRSVDRRCQ